MIIRQPGRELPYLRQQTFRRLLESAQSYGIQTSGYKNTMRDVTFLRRQLTNAKRIRDN